MILLLTLIPKVLHPEYISRFRPITLCNVSYKIITKTMANRLKEIMQGVVGPNQSSFVSSRQIVDNVVLYQEVLHSMRLKNSRKGIMTIKIDLEKAYDRLYWDFIQETLELLGLPPFWVCNFMSYIETLTLSILWNGKKLESFKPS